MGKERISMAKLKINYLKPVVPKINDVVLTMTEPEARVLMAVLIHIGGETKGPRGLIDNIYQVLENKVIPAEVRTSIKWGDLYIHSPDWKKN
jgi:hypothetical protein